MWKLSIASLFLVATLFAATEGLKCKSCFYVELSKGNFSVPNLPGLLNYTSACADGEDGNLSVTCPANSNCVKVMHEGTLQDVDHTVTLRGCYQQSRALNESDMECTSKTMKELFDATTNTQIRGVINLARSAGISDNEKGDVCHCNGDDCNPASIMSTFSASLMAGIGAILYAFN